MKEFKVGSVWRARNGEKAVVVDWKGDDSKYPIKVFYTRANLIDCLLPDGSLVGDIKEHERDLIEPWKEPVKHKGWVNVYKDLGVKCCGPVHKTADDANRATWGNRIACLKIEFEEGQGL